MEERDIGPASSRLVRAAIRGGHQIPTFGQRQRPLSSSSNQVIVQIAQLHIPPRTSKRIMDGGFSH